MREVALAVFAAGCVGALLWNWHPPQGGQPGFYSAVVRRSNCPPRPYYARSERPRYEDDPRWERVEQSPRSRDEYNDPVDLSTSGSTTTVVRR